MTVYFREIDNAHEPTSKLVIFFSTVLLQFVQFKKKFKNDFFGLKKTFWNYPCPALQIYIILPLEIKIIYFFGNFPNKCPLKTNKNQIFII